MIKEIKVDYDDLKDLKKWIYKLQDRRKTVLRNLGCDQIHFTAGNHNAKTLLPEFEKMYAKDFTYLYENKNPNDKTFYVYFHCNPLKPLLVKQNIKHLFLASKFTGLKYEPFYVGKGKGNRYLDFNRNDSHRKIRTQLNNLKLEIEPVIIATNLSESESFNIESNLIDILGLLCFNKNGILCNLDEGKYSDLRRKTYVEDKWCKRILKANGVNI